MENVIRSYISLCRSWLLREFYLKLHLLADTGYRDNVL